MIDPSFEIRNGVGVLIFNPDGRILLGKRLGNTHGSGTYGPPGGHVEPGETLKQAIIRETAEETGLNIYGIEFSFTTTVLDYPPRHYIHTGFIAKTVGTPELREPDKVESWNWYNLRELPGPLLVFAQRAIHCYMNRTPYFD